VYIWLGGCFGFQHGLIHDSKDFIVQFKRHIKTSVSVYTITLAVISTPYTAAAVIVVLSSRGNV